jgi:GNAT superfamily N-acetyltransferase
VQELIQLKEDHLEDAAALVSRHYINLREQNPYLPQSYTQVPTLLPLLQNIIQAGCPGVAAINKGKLVGFLTGWQMPSFRGKRSTYSPEWANATTSANSQQIYKEMYSYLADIWVTEHYVDHYISLFSNNVQALRVWYWMNFGMISVDAIRGLDAIPCQNNIYIRRAGAKDLERVMELHEALQRYMKGPPIYLLTDTRNRIYYAEWLQDPEKAVWLAYWHNEPAAFMRMGPADDDVCTIIYDEKTTSIYAAYTIQKARSAGIATALLNHALQAALTKGYERCAVSFEPMNLLGTRFWLKYFRPVCFSVVRHIDDRLTQSQDERYRD